MPTITSTGLGSGLDIKGLVSGLVSAEGTPATNRLNTQEAKLTAQISSYGNLKSAMSSFQSSLSGLKYASAFQKLTATSSDTTFVTASALSNADVASYNVEVKALAKNQALVVTTPYASATSTVGTGTLTIKFGTNNVFPPGAGSFVQDASQGTLSLTVDATNNTVAGLSLAINQANAGVTASVVTDNTGAHLVLNSTKTGANSSMEITGTLTALAYNSTTSTMTQNQAAQDASVAINGLTISSSSNTVSSALKGLTLNLQQAQVGKIVTVGVSQNNADITTAINGFVKGFNDLLSIVTPMTGYDAVNKKGGVLQGDSTVNTAMAQLRSQMGSMVSGLTGSAQSLADIGITRQKDGTLALDSAMLTSQLASNPSGVTAVFAVLGTPTSANVLVSSSTTNTQAGQYAVNITQLATRGALNGAPPTSLIMGAANTFAINVDGIQSGTIALTQQTYASYAALATEMQSRINGDSAIKAAGKSIGVTYDTVGNRMVFTSQSYGTPSQVAITANTTTTLGLSVATGVAGVDVAGTIDGLIATGSGQTLTSTGGASNGLGLLFNGTTLGANGTVGFSRGVIEGLDNLMTSVLSNTTGTLKNRTDTLQKSVAAIATERTKLADRLDKLQTSLFKQFNAMDRLLGKMQSTTSFLTQQFAPKPTQ
jgi:flagellar hook-associated protein 2